MARSRVANTVAGALALAVGGTLLLVTVPSQANHTTGAGTFTCRASTVRTENSSVAAANVEPFAANRVAGQACTTDSEGPINDGQPQSVTLLNLGTVDVLYARTNGTAHTAESGVAAADLLVGTTPIRAGVLTSTASGGTCPAPGFTSSSTIASVTVGNTTIPVPATADATPDVTLPANLGVVYLNYQTTSTVGSDQVRTQRALYVDVDQTVLPAVPDVIIAEAIADTHGNPCPAATTTTSSTTTSSTTSTSTTSTSTTSTSTTSTTSTTTTTIAGRCPPPSPEGDPATDDSPIDKDCGYGQPSGVTKKPKS